MQADNLARQVKTLNDTIRKITIQKEGIFNELRDGQEQLRLSNNQINKLRGETEQYRLTIEDFKRKSQDVKISEYESKIALFSQ